MDPLNDANLGAPEPTEYFAYGSNMSTARLQRRTPSAEPLGVATLAGHTLRFHKRSKKDGSAKCDAFATPNEDATVVGVLFRFDPAERAKLDAAEGAGRGYDARVVTVVSSDGCRRKALSYFASPDAVDTGLKPYTWYRDHVLAGAEEHGIPPEYVAQYIDSVEAVEDPDRERDKSERAALSKNGT